MISYQSDPSQFFEANKTYCEEIESKLRLLNYECSGFCSAYGYDIECTLVKDRLKYTLKLHKHQSTQNGVVIPVNAINYAGIEILISGLNKKLRISIGRSVLFRFFMKGNLKKKINEPYYLNINFQTSDNSLNQLMCKIYENEISKLKLRRGTLVCKLHSSKINPLNLMIDLEETIRMLESV